MKKLINLLVIIFLITLIFAPKVPAITITDNLIAQVAQEVKTDLGVVKHKTILGKVVSSAENTNNYGYLMSQGIYPMQQVTPLINVGWEKNLYCPPPESTFVLPDIIADDPNTTLWIIVNADMNSMLPMNEEAFKGLITFKMIEIHGWECKFMNSLDIYTPEGELITHNDPAIHRIVYSFALSKMGVVIPIYEFTKWAYILSPPINGVPQWMGFSPEEVKDQYCRNIDLLLIYETLYGYEPNIPQVEWDIYNYLQAN